LIARKILDVLETFTESLEHYLRQGKIEPSCHLILQFAAHEESLQATARIVQQTLEHLLEQFAIEPVNRFCAEMDTSLPGEIVEPIKEKIGRRMAVIQDWSGKITLVARERQARDLRAAVRARNLAEIERCAMAILLPGGRTEPDRSLVQYVGNILGSIEFGQREVEQLIARLRSSGRLLGLSSEMIELMENARRERQREAARGRFDFPEAEFVRDLNALTVELKGWLPGPRVAGLPTDEHIERFYHALHALAATIFLSGDTSRWMDVSFILVEYCPRELSVAGRRSGVEERAYMTLTPTSRRTVFEAFGRLGHNDAVARSYLNFAQSVEEERLVRYVVEVMGAMRSKLFFPYLRTAFDNQSRPSIRNTALVAASNYADGDSAEFILRALTEAIRKGVRRGLIPEGPARRDVVEAMFALGRLVRSPRMDPGGRNEILKRAIRLVPGKEPHLLQELAYQCFCTPSEGWDGALRDWAVATLARSLWLADVTPDFAPGDDRQTSIVGARTPTVQALVAIGREGMPTLLRTCEESDLRFGVPYIALAEVFGQIGDARALDLLEKMLANALLFEGSGRTKYQVEKYYDATEGVRKELTSDQVAAALLFAVEQIGGEQADRILVRAYSQIRAPGASSPGAETDALLEKAHTRLMHEGRWNDLVRQAGERRTERPAERDEAAEREAVAHAIKALQTKFFLTGGRRRRKISAIQTLANLRNLDAIPLIVSHLDDSDSLVRGAAETALGEYVWAASNEMVFRGLVYALLDGLHSRNDTTRDTIRAILKRLGPTHEPLHSKLLALSQQESDALLRSEANRLLREGMEFDKTEALGTPSEARESEVSESPETEQTPPRETPRKVSLDEVIRQRREYLQARQAWIRGGKKGEPPKPPLEP